MKNRKKLENKKSIKELLTKKNYLYLIILWFYTTFIISKTLIIRTHWEDPFSNIMGGWTIYQQANGMYNVESIENLLFFSPFILLLYLSFPILTRYKSNVSIVLQSLCIGFLCSLFIETCQVIFSVGTFQFADLFYNTLGTVIGAFLFFIARMKFNPRTR